MTATLRWTARRKDALLTLAEVGLMDAAEVRHRWQITEDEWASWTRGVAVQGRNGLKATRCQEPGLRHVSGPLANVMDGVKAPGGVE